MIRSHCVCIASKLFALLLRSHFTKKTLHISFHRRKSMSHSQSSTGIPVSREHHPCSLPSIPNNTLYTTYLRVPPLFLPCTHLSSQTCVKHSLQYPLDLHSCYCYVHILAVGGGSFANIHKQHVYVSSHPWCVYRTLEAENFLSFPCATRESVYRAEAANMFSMKWVCTVCGVMY